MSHPLRRPLSLLPFALLAACAGNTDPAAGGSDSSAEVWPPPAPEHGIQLVIDDVTLGVGEELEMCRPVQADNPEGGMVTRIELYANDGLHHTFITKGDEGILTQEEACFGLPEAAMEGYSIPEPLYASSTQVGRETVEFPEGVGVSVEAAQNFIINYHLTNYTGDVLDAEVYLNLHFADEDETAGMETAGLYVMGNITDWTVPAGGTGEITFSCPFPEAVDVFSLTPHMHAMGTGFKATDLDSGEVLMESDDWNSPTSTYLEPVRHFEEGEGMTVTCEWANTTDQDAEFGGTSNDEMCFLFGYHWPAASSMRFLSEYTGCTVQ